MEKETLALAEKDVQNKNGGMDTSDHYSFYVDCSNCDFGGKVWIKKGFLLLETKCSNCECLTLKKR